MEQESRPQKIICIIDDNEDIRDIYSVKFRSQGFVVMTAKDGEEGLEVIRQARPDIILLDIQMPLLDGMSALKIMKNDPELMNIPVIILSNIDNDVTFREVSDLGAAQYYLIKSLTDPQKVLDIAMEVLRDRESAAE